MMDINEAKNIEFYSATVSAWFETRLEQDKSLLTLSSGGIALLITLLTSNGITSAEGLTLNILAITSFVISIITVVFIFKFNGDHLIELVSTPEKRVETLLHNLDRTAQVSFVAGVILTSVIGVSAAIQSYSKKEIDMSNNHNPYKTSFAKDSFAGISKLQSQTPATAEKSFTGAAALKPQPAQPAGNSGSNPTPASTSK